MAKARLPSKPQDTWEGGFVFDPVREVRSVDARNGLVVAGGSELYLMRPGEEHIKHREPPLDIGPVHVAAAEPRGARRYAFAAQEMLALFLRVRGEDQILRLRPAAPAAVATHLAWAGTQGTCALHVRWEDGEVARLKPDLSDIEMLDLPEMDALAADDAGVLAMVSLAPEPLVFVTRDGETLHFRSLGEDVTEGDGPVHLAVAGAAVAVSLASGVVLVSRGEDDPFAPCDALDGAGPLAFEGTSSDAALFGAICQGSEGCIVRAEKTGAAMRIAELGSDDGPDLEIVSLAWDASRSRLWGASPQAGLLMSTAPSAKRGKKILS